MSLNSQLTWQDRLGSLRVYLGILRDNYQVQAGLYSLGNPSEDAPVLVTANYKLTVDVLRAALQGRNLWILVLDTKGVNVWCAAGKGTFSTQAVIQAIEENNLQEVLTSRLIILPQLAATGVAAHAVQQATGFKTIFGPVKAADLSEFLDRGNHKTAEESKITFTLSERFLVSLADLKNTLRDMLVVFGLMFCLNMLKQDIFQTRDAGAYFLAIITGSIITPLLLPYIPVAAFSLKGWFLGVVLMLGYLKLLGMDLSALFLAYLLIFPAISAYYALNYTGSSTYTSLSGVEKETRLAIPWLILSLVCGIVIFVLVKGVG